MSFSPALEILRPLVRLLEKEARSAIAFAKRRCTPLAVLALFIAGAAFFFFAEYVSRRDHWNCRLWKNRAAAKTACFGALLIAIKLLIGSL